MGRKVSIGFREVGASGEICREEGQGGVGPRGQAGAGGERAHVSERDSSDMGLGLEKSLAVSQEDRGYCNGGAVYDSEVVNDMMLLLQFQLMMQTHIPPEFRAGIPGLSLLLVCPFTTDCKGRGA